MGTSTCDHQFGEGAGASGESHHGVPAARRPTRTPAGCSTHAVRAGATRSPTHRTSSFTVADPVCGTALGPLCVPTGKEAPTLSLVDSRGAARSTPWYMSLGCGW